jgi:phenylalanine-4-hydroxylase
MSHTATTDASAITFTAKTDDIGLIFACVKEAEPTSFRFEGTSKNEAKEVSVTCEGTTKTALEKAFNDHSVDASKIIKFTMEEFDFPRHKSDLDAFANKTLALGEGLTLTDDHPGAKDKKYIESRNLHAETAINYRHGEAIPDAHYTLVETETWKTVYENLFGMYSTHACSEYQVAMKSFQDECNFSAEAIPQQAVISRFLMSRTGFTLRPVAGLLSARNFLNGLAFRVFHATQYIRHHSKPLYTPEPDVCHELLGHVPLFADPTFADFSHEIGLLSIGASDWDIERLSTLYWFTIEFGLTKEANGEMRAYGAGLLSSFGELEYCLSDKPKVLPFDPEVASTTEYPITCFQPTYFCAESFADALAKVRAFAKGMNRTFSVTYDAETESLKVHKV